METGDSINLNRGENYTKKHRENEKRGDSLMSFTCKACGVEIIKNASGQYITGCPHHPINADLPIFDPVTGSAAAEKFIEDYQMSKSEVLDSCPIGGKK